MPTPKQKAAEAKKLEAERLQGFLQEMLREEENKYCADCEGKQPRWASWNLGVFLCIRCAGLHRNLGVHISKVKSVTLDSWTPEQVQSMRVMGNAKARAVYECELPTVFRRPQTDQSLEQFIRAKYESKRYLMKGWVPPRIDVNDLPAFPETMARDKKAAALLAYNNGKRPTISNESAFDNKRKQSSPPITERAIVPELINFDFSAPANPTEDFLNTDINQQTDLSTIDDLFGPIVTAAPPLQQSIPASLSTPNLSNATNSNDFFSSGIFLTNNEPQNFKHQQVKQSNMNIDQKGGHTNTQHQSGIGTGFDLVSNLSIATNAHNPSQLLSNSSLIGSDLLGLDLSMCTLSNQSGNQIQTSQSSTMLSSPPATDMKKSTNEILALFNK